jgi:hypothetical protein
MPYVVKAEGKAKKAMEGNFIYKGQDIMTDAIAPIRNGYLLDLPGPTLLD